MPRRRRTALALFATAGLALGACGNDDDGTASPAPDDTAEDTTTTTEGPSGEVDQDVLDRISEAAGNTVEQGTARFTATAETRGTGEADGTSEVEVEGEVDFEGERRRLTFVGPDGDLDMVFDGSVVYIELPATEGDDWARIDLDRLLDDELGMGGPGALPFQDPADNLRVLEGTALEASELGTDDVDGTETTNYRVIIDLRAAGEEADDPDVADAVERTADRTGLEELELQVWVDDDDLIRRVEYRLDLHQIEVSEQDANGDGGTVEADPEGATILRIEYRDFGQDLEIEVPEDAQIVDIDEDAIRDSLEGTGTTGTGAEDTTTGSNGTTGTGDTDDTTTG